MDHSEQLLALFRRCTARVSDRQSPDERGTGFFVAPGLLLTCAHVVKESWDRADSVAIEWEGRSYTASLERYLDAEFPDLALLKIVQKIGAHPCVYLHESVDLNDKLYSYGYTDNYRNGDSATFECEGWADQQKLLKLKGGEVRHGLSGAPILNLRTGGVCALVKLTRGVDTSMGGRAVPTSTVLRQFPELIVQQKNFLMSDNSWYRHLSPQQIQLLGLPVSSNTTSNTIEIFYLYADVNEDRFLLERLDKHLAVMRRQGLISTWNKSKIEYGADIQSEIDRHLEQAQIILFMVSSDFLAAYYLDDDSSIERALARRITGAIVIPVLLRQSDWEESPFGGLKSLPPDGRPIAAWSNKDEALYQVAIGLKAVVNRLRAGKRD
jgi:Trypsin-like peptidase domain/TIR domain